jgi:hypothetical protein
VGQHQEPDEVCRFAGRPGHRRKLKRPKAGIAGNLTDGVQRRPQAIGDRRHHHGRMADNVAGVRVIRRVGCRFGAWQSSLPAETVGSTS